jgi:hypothetical protein
VRGGGSATREKQGVSEASFVERTETTMFSIGPFKSHGLSIKKYFYIGLNSDKVCGIIDITKEREGIICY